MTTLTKRGARKIAASASKPSIGFVSLTYSGLAQRDHISVQIGDYTLRVELSDADRWAAEFMRLAREGREAQEPSF